LGAYLGFRLPDPLKEKVDASAAEAGRSLSAETAIRLAATYEEQDALDRAQVLAFGPDNGPLLFLVGEVLRIAAAHGGEWLDDDAAAKDVAAAYVHLLRRLRSPDDGATASNGVEKRVDDLLFDMGYTGAEHRAEQSPRARWAAEKRSRFGIYAERLIRYREAVTKELQAQPPREMAQPPPDVWEHAIARQIAQAEAERAKRRIESIRRQIGRLAEMDVDAAPAYRAHERRLIEFRIATLDDADDAVRKELLDLLASASPEAESA
jgi:hypothetical protein